jgi:hypothetical protein
MLKEYDPPKEPLRIKAERKWKNNALRKRLIEERKRPKFVDPNKEPEVAGTIINDGRVDGPVKRFETQFLKDIRAMLEGHTQRNLQLYAEMIERRRYLLLKEKLKRLRAAQQSQGASHDQSV